MSQRKREALRLKGFEWWSCRPESKRRACHVELGARNEVSNLRTCEVVKLVMKPAKSIFSCQACGAQAPKWLGRCPECGAWNSFVEETAAPASVQARSAATLGGGGALLYRDVDTVVSERISSGVSEFDRVLGGGIVPGSLVLLGGEPGIGKSTLLLQAAAHFAAHVGPVLYCSGEESEHQIKMRGERLGVSDAPLYLLAETCVERLLEAGRSAQARAADRGLDSDRVFAEAPVRPGQRRAGAAGGHRSVVCGQGKEPADDSGRACHEGRKPRRPQGARARGRHRSVLRGPSTSLPPGRSCREEPVRGGQRARRVRNDRRRTASRAESFEAVPRGTAR